MVDADALIAGLEPTLIIKDEVMYVDNLNEVGRLIVGVPLQTRYNAFIFCRRGRLYLELGGNQTVHVAEGQMLIVPTKKLMQPMMVSTDIDAVALLVSERVQKSILGKQLDIWNRAMYLHETHVIDTRRWSEALHNQAQNVFKGEQLTFRNEFVLSFLRIFMLIVCEELSRKEELLAPLDVSSSDREKMLFNQFLDLLHVEQIKRRKVGYYSAKLYVTPKYLSKVCSKVSGKTPMRWITEAVMSDCYQLLRDTQLTVKEISNRLGFPNSSFFGQYFREQAGITPIEYRSKYRKEF